MWPGVDFLNMTNCLFDAHVAMMESVRAERVLDMAQAAAYPLYVRHSPRHAQKWWQGLMHDVNAVFVGTARGSMKRGAMFTFNGMSVGISTLRTKLSAALGQGFRE